MTARAVLDVPAIGHLPARRRYVRTPGWREWRGMYKRRRVSRIVQPTLVDDAAQAHSFADAGAARRSLEATLGARGARRFTVERLDARSGAWVAVEWPALPRGLGGRLNPAAAARRP